MKHLCEGRRSRNHVCEPLGTSSVRQIHFVLTGAGQRGVRWKYLTINPAEHAQPPAAERTTPDPPNQTEAAAILNEAWKTPAWGTLLWVVMVAGCRRGELCALRWSDIDLERGKVAIDTALTRKLREKATKTEQDRRLSIDPYTVDLLLAHKRASEEQCLSLGTRLTRDS